MFDFENPNKTIFVELKSRRIKHNAYDTAIIGLNKIAFSDQLPEAEFWFAFCYSDGLYVIKYDKEVFDTLEVRHDYRRGPRNDVHNNAQSVVFIPITLLTKVDADSLADKPTGPVGVEDEKDEKGVNGTSKSMSELVLE